jgi:hypothetical protein
MTSANPAGAFTGRTGVMVVGAVPVSPAKARGAATSPEAFSPGLPATAGPGAAFSAAVGVEMADLTGWGDAGESPKTGDNISQPAKAAVTMLADKTMNIFIFYPFSLAGFCQTLGAY